MVTQQDDRWAKMIPYVLGILGVAALSLGGLGFAHLIGTIGIGGSAALMVGGIVAMIGGIYLYNRTSTAANSHLQYQPTLRRDELKTILPSAGEDPLSTDQKQAILIYLREKFLVYDQGQLKHRFHESPVLSGVLAKAYTKERDRSYLESAKKTLGEDVYCEIRQVVKNPARKAKEFKIDPNNSSQVFAARVFIKAFLKQTTSHVGNFDMEFVQSRYFAKFEGGHRGFVYLERLNQVNTKNRILMRDDPVTRLDPANNSPSALDFVLANVHFIEPKMKITTNGVAKFCGPTREEAREIIEEIFAGLWKNPETSFVIAALARLIQQEKANIIFSNNPHGVGSLGTHYRGVSNTVLGGTNGFWAQGHHTIYLPSLINPYDKKVIKSHIGTLVHEALHMLIYTVYGCDYLCVDECERIELLEVIERDKQYRKRIKPNGYCERLMEQALVGDLEQDTSYFPGGYKPGDTDHQNTMMEEAIVRPLEIIAAFGKDGARAAMQIAPNLTTYFNEKVKPRLIEYAERQH